MSDGFEQQLAADDAGGGTEEKRGTRAIEGLSLRRISPKLSGVFMDAKCSRRTYSLLSELL
jgi:hypothetical protein